MFELGVETHTFTAIGRCPRTGRLGISVTTSEIATGGRVPTIKANVGAVATQAYTDPRLGALGIQLLELGYPAERVLAELKASDPYVGWRQTGIIDRWGHAAVHTGESNSEWAGHRTGEAYVVMGNALVGEWVVDAMAQAMQNSGEEDIGERLVRAIEAGNGRWRTAGRPKIRGGASI